MKIRKNEENIEILKNIKSIILKNKSNLIKAFELDNKEWKYQVNFDDVINLINIKIAEKGNLKFTKKEIVNGIGNIALINTTSFPLVNLNIILSSIRTNNNLTIFLENKFLASNRIIIEIINEAVEDEDMLQYKFINKKEDFYNYENKFDRLLYVGNDKEYVNFSNRLEIESIFENYGEIYVFLDNNIEEFKEKIELIDSYAYENEIRVNYYKDNIEGVINSINDSYVKNMVVIFSKDIENVYKFINKIKSNNLLVNVNPFENNYTYMFDEKRILYIKKIVM